MPIAMYEKYREVCEYNYTSFDNCGKTFFLYIHPNTLCIHAIPDIETYAKLFILSNDYIIWRSAIACIGSSGRNTVETYTLSIQELKNFQ